MEGTRPLLVEVQALVAPTDVVPPRRVANGIDRNRLAMILAVLSRHGGVGVGNADVFVNVAGGVRVDEPGADLAIALAIASAHRGEPLSDRDGPAARLLRRGRADRRAALRRPRRAPRRRGAQVRALAGARPGDPRGTPRARAGGDAAGRARHRPQAVRDAAPRSRLSRLARAAPTGGDAGRA